MKNIFLFTIALIMKNIFLFIIAVISSLLLLRCAEKRKNLNELGYIVEKDYEQQRMCCSDIHFERKLIIIVPHTHTPPHHHHKINAIFTLWFANRETTKSYNVDSITWTQFNPGDKVISQLDTNNNQKFYIIKQ